MIEPQPTDGSESNPINKPGESELPEEDILPDEPVENTGMDLGVTYKEDREQDLDDLVHQQGILKKNEIPPPEES